MGPTPPAPSAPVDVDRVVPVLQPTGFLERARAARRPGGPLHHEPLVDGVAVLYVEDGADPERYLTALDVERLGLAPAALRARAVDNLRRRLPSVERHGGPDVHLVAAGGTYEASLLLDDAFWSGGDLAAEGDVVVAVPSQDVLMVTGSRVPMGVARLRQLAREYAAKSANLVTADLLVRRDGTWEVLPAWQPTRPPGGGDDDAQAPRRAEGRRGCLSLLPWRRRSGSPRRP